MIEMLSLLITVKDKMTFIQRNTKLNRLKGDFVLHHLPSPTTDPQVGILDKVVKQLITVLFAIRV